MSAEPELIRGGLERFLAHLGAPPVDIISELSSRWAELVGPRLAEYCSPVHLVDGVLVVRCSDGAWASQLKWSEAQLSARFTQVFPQVDFVRLVIRVGL